MNKQTKKKKLIIKKPRKLIPLKRCPPQRVNK